MNEDPIIDGALQVIPLVTSIAHPIRALATLRGRDETQIFGPAPNPEMRGRRPSGVVMPAANVPKEMQGTPLHDGPVYAISKRSAKGVAEILTGCPVRVYEKEYRCRIEVVFPGQRLEFSAPTWFRALASLKSYLDDRLRRRSEQRHGSQHHERPGDVAGSYHAA
jgi:hypothetical protein